MNVRTLMYFGYILYDLCNSFTVTEVCFCVQWLQYDKNRMF